MSMLEEQIKELREVARNMQGNLGRCLYRRKDVDEMQRVSGMLFEAADTIDSLRDRLQEVSDQTCYATQANYERCKYSTDRGWCDTSKYAELFGTPERAARTLMGICDECDESACSGCKIDPLVGYATNYDALLKWLEGGVE